MTGSKETKQLDAAWAAAKAEISSPAKDGRNPHFKSSYQTLNAIQNAVFPVLEKHGLSYAASPSVLVSSIGFYDVLGWSLTHIESGEHKEDVCPLRVDRDGAQALGSSITYMRRYNLSALFGLNADDDDGEGAEQRKPKPTANAAGAKPAESQPAPSNLTVDMIIADLKKCKDEGDTQKLVRKHTKFIAMQHPDTKAKFRAAYDLKMAEFQHNQEGAN